VVAGDVSGQLQRVDRPLPVDGEPAPRFLPAVGGVAATHVCSDPRAQARLERGTALPQRHPPVRIASSIRRSYEVELPLGTDHPEPYSSGTHSAHGSESWCSLVPCPVASVTSRAIEELACAAAAGRAKR